MHASNSSYASKRKMATMFCKIFKFNPLASEKKQREVSRARYSLKSFSKWDLCLLTGYDRDIEWRLCSTCQKRTHLFCQVYSDQDLALEHFQCRACTGVLGLDDIKYVLSETLALLPQKSQLNWPDWGRRNQTWRKNAHENSVYKNTYFVFTMIKNTYSCQCCAN